MTFLAQAADPTTWQDVAMHALAVLGPAFAAVLLAVAAKFRKERDAERQDHERTKTRLYEKRDL